MKYNIDILLKAHEIAALRILETWKAEADTQAAFFKSTYPKAGKVNSPGFLNLIRQTYQATALFPNAFFQEKLTRLGFANVLNQDGLRWFIPADSILATFEAMKKDGVVRLLWFPALVGIKFHLDIKINVTIQQWAGLTALLNNKEHATRSKADLYRFYRRINPEKRVIARGKGTHDELQVALINYSQIAFGDFLTTRKALLQLADGNTKKTFLRGIIHCAVEQEKSDNYFRSFYELFRLIDPDLGLRGEDQYDERGYEGVFFPSYQAKRVRDIVT